MVDQSGKHKRLQIISAAIQDSTATEALKTEMVFQHDEKKKRAAELLIANKELAFQNEEKEKRAAELLIANKELAFQNEEKEKRAAELLIANQELAFQNDEKEKRAAELILINTELKAAKESQQNYITGMQEMIFMASHKIRQPIVHILGLSNLLDTSSLSKEEMMEIMQMMKQPAQNLDQFTRELIAYISKLDDTNNTQNKPI